MTVTSEILADKVVELLKSRADQPGGLAGVASTAVFGVRAWPTADDDLPQIQLALPEEDKTSLRRNAGNQFIVVATLPLLITVRSPADLDEAGAAAARGQLADIGRLIERTLIGEPTLQRLIQRVAFVRSHGRVDGRGEEIAGQRVLMLGLEFYQGPEDFYVQLPERLEQMTVSDPPADGHAGTGRIKIDFPT